MSETSDGQFRQRLKNLSAATAAARNEHAACRQAMKEARETVAKLKISDEKITRTSEWRAAEEAKEALEAVDRKVRELDDAKVGILEMLGESSGARPGQDGPVREGGRGLAHVATGLDRTRESVVEMPARDMLAAGLTVTPSSGLSAPAIIAPFTPKAQPRQFLFTSFPAGEVEDEDLAVTDFSQTGSRTVTGTVLRDPIAATEKAKLELSVSLVTTPLKQAAIVIHEIPNQLFLSVELFEQWLQSELLYQLQLAVEAHVLAQIAAASPPHGLEGTTLIEQVRHGVAEMKDAGATPSVLALSPADAEALDVQKSTGSGEYIFASRDAGTASPIFGCDIVEVAGLEAPVLVDPIVAGVLYLGLARTIADPYSGNDHNVTKIVSEVNGLMHIRDTAGLFVIEDEE